MAAADFTPLLRPDQPRHFLIGPPPRDPHRSPPACPDCNAALVEWARGRYVCPDCTRINPKPSTNVVH